jgi:hypothetical protein
LDGEDIDGAHGVPCSAADRDRALSASTVALDVRNSSETCAAA